MQKIINVLSVASFVVSASVVGSAIYVFANKDALIDSAKAKIMGQVGAIAGDAVKGLIPPAPKVPNATGPVISAPSAGFGIPK
tara:strand:- start:2167 stop:2415 length:249 start_codon:yes stop_codon:yes gene_type:complete